MVLEPEESRLRWFALTAGEYVEVDRSEILGVDVAEVASQLDW